MSDHPEGDDVRRKIIAYLRACQDELPDDMAAWLEVQCRYIAAIQMGRDILDREEIER